MITRQHFSLKDSNSFNIESVCPNLFLLEHINDLQCLPNLDNVPFYVLGEGSNTLFINSQAPTIIRPLFKGIEITELNNNYIVKVGAGENWHNLVCYLVNKGIFGLENLALIPGSVGAAPIQNIGAYGVEFADFCDEVNWFDFASKKITTMLKHQCNFSYRDSIFKNALLNKGLITEVVFRFPKEWTPNVSYKGLASYKNSLDASKIMAKIIQMRQAKLPDPKNVPNAGSFFKNPYISKEMLSALKDNYEDVPYYQQADDKIKIAAGWLIEQTGLKGYKYKCVGVHTHQALVLVNYASSSGQDIIELAQIVQSAVYDKFNIKIDPEVRFITINGEEKFDAIIQKNGGKSRV